MSKSIFGWSLPPGCGRLPGEEPVPPSCEDCPEEKFEKCPGQDKCIEVVFDTRPMCCLKHRQVGSGGYCGECEAEAFMEVNLY